MVNGKLMSRMAKIVEKELSYRIVGVLFEVHRELGGEYQEKYYQRAASKALQQAKLAFKEQIPVDLKYKDEKIGKYFIDFLVENKVVLELKASPTITAADIRQVLAYLKAARKELAIVANFRGPRLQYKRIVNPEVHCSD